MSVWTATIVRLSSAGTMQEVAVILASDTGDKFQQSYPTDGTLASLVPQVLATITSQNAKTHKSELVIGPLDLTQNGPVPSDPAVVQFQNDLAALRREERAVAEQLTTGADVVALRKTVQAQLTANPALGAFL